MGASRGQASVEWLAIVLLVAAVLLAAVAGALPGADAVPRAVGAAFARAFCLVGGGDCLAGAPRPCVVASDDRSRERRVSVAAGRLADGRRVLREERSDGSVAITVEDMARLGGAVSAGAQLTAGGRGVKAAAEAEAHAVAERGRRFVVADGGAADVLVARLSGEREGVRSVLGGRQDGPVADERWRAIGQGGEGTAEVGMLKLGADASAVTRTVAGVRWRPATGERTLVLRNGTELLAALTAPFTEIGMGVPASTAIELGFDRDGRPASLVVRGARGVQGTVEVDGLRSGGGDLVEAEARLDLADPVARALASDLVDPARAPGAARALAARLADRARIDVRLYATDRSASTKGAAGGFLVKFGLEVEEVMRTARLVDAAGREPGLGWARRLDCVGVA